MKSETKQAIKEFIPKAIISLVLIAGIIVGVYFLYRHLGWDRFRNREEFQAYISTFGGWAPAIFILASFLQVTFVPIPGAVTIVAGSFLFGSGMSFLYSYIGMMAGAILAFWLGRWIGRPFVDWLSGGKEKTDKLIAKLKNKQNVVLFFMFLLPFFPDDLLCAIAGILPMHFLTFFIMQVITRATSIGATLLFMSGEFIPWTEPWGIAVLVIVGVLAIVAFIISFKYSERIEAWGMRIIDRVFKRKEEGDKDQ